MGTKDLKSEARQKLPLNMHIAVAVYAVEFVLFVMIISIIVMSCIALSSANKTADIVDALVSEQTVTAVADGEAAADTGAEQAENTQKPITVGSANRIGIVLMIIYGCVLFMAALAGSGILSYAMADCYLSSYKCKPYGARGLAESLARGGVGKVVVVNSIRASLGFLLLLCLIVPGVIYLIRTSMANHLLLANPKMKATTALSASNKVMSGKTGGYFSLEMSFFGWILLGIVTLGVAFVFILPYMNLTKTVYYKRNLQGDKTVYKFQPMPVNKSAQPAPNVAPTQQVVRPISSENINMQGMPMQSMPLQQDTPPAVNEPIAPVTPMDTLDAEDVRAMNDAMRDVGNHEPAEIPDIPEIPISPVTTTKRAVEKNSVSTPVGKPVEDSDFVEIVKPLSTGELPDDNALERDMDRLFNGTPQQNQPPRNYFPHSDGGSGNQNPNDFVTMESETGRGNNDFDLDAEPMSDEKFNEFMRQFDEMTTAERNAKERPNTLTEREGGISYGATDTEPLTTRHRPSSAMDESRTERIRREREERLRKLRNG